MLARASTEGEVKVTAPPDLIRNRKARPDTWETEVIGAQFLSPSWPKGQAVSAVADSKCRQAFRVAVPKYYAASCLACHGGPKGDIDVTGYPKEGRSEGDLGGVIHGIEALVPMAGRDHDAALIPPLQLTGGDAGQCHYVPG